MHPLMVSQHIPLDETATGNSSNLQSILSSLKVFYPQNQITAHTLAHVWAQNIVRWLTNAERVWIGGVRTWDYE